MFILLLFRFLNNCLTYLTESGCKDKEKELPEDGGRREDTRTFPSLARTQRQLVLVGRKTVYP